MASFKKAYETFRDIDFFQRTPPIPGINADEERIRAVLAFIRPHKDVIDCELLPYHRPAEQVRSLGRGVSTGRSQKRLPATWLSDSKPSSARPLIVFRKGGINHLIAPTRFPYLDNW